jgi:hypothetical protein
MNESLLHDGEFAGSVMAVPPSRAAPTTHSTPPEHHAKIDAAARALLALEREFAQADPSNPSISEPKA